MILLLGFHHKEIIQQKQKAKRTNIFRIASSMAADKWEQPTCPVIRDSLGKFGISTQYSEYYETVEKITTKIMY